MITISKNAACPLSACKKSGECARHENYLEAKAERMEYLTPVSYTHLTLPTR